MTPSPRLVSNEIEDFAEGGGLYPGGTGILEEVSYRLWDYNGTKPKDSFCSAYLRFRPVDGSNSGKVVEQYYSIGSSSDFVPDPTGGHIMSLRDKNVTNSTNWGHFLKVLRDNCGLEKGKLSGPTGIRVMERGVMTLVQVDQPHREGLDELPKTNADDKKKFKPKTLVPTRAVFVWDPNYQNATRNVQAPAQTQQPMAPPPQQQYQQPYQQPTQPTAQAPAYQQPVNGAPVQQSVPMANGDYSLASVVKALLVENGGSLSVSELPAKVLLKLAPPVDRSIRVNVSKESKDMAMLSAIAQANGWTLSGDDLIG